VKCRYISGLFPHFPSGELTLILELWEPYSKKKKKNQTKKQQKTKQKKKKKPSKASHQGRSITKILYSLCYFYRGEGMCNIRLESVIG
jgi:hypothetical protein